MRFLSCFLILIFCFGLPVQAQDSSIYNSKQSNKNNENTIYNSRSGSAYGSGPISIKSMTSGAKQARIKSSSVQRPYSLGGKKGGYSLSLTPQQVRDKQAKAVKRAKKNAVEAKKKKKKRAEERERAVVNVGSIEEKTNRYTSRFQGKGVEEVDEDSEDVESVVIKKKRKRVYVRDKDGLTSPERVFDSIY